MKTLSSLAALLAAVSSPTAQVSLVRDINQKGPPNPSSDPFGFVRLGPWHYFRATTSDRGSELYRTLGTPQSLQLVKDIRPGTAGSGISALMAAGPLLYFAADDGTSGSELWRSDGTTAGTVLVADIAPGSASSSPTGLVAHGAAVFFQATGAQGKELYKTDGTAAGTVLVRDIAPGGADSAPSGFAALGNELFFSAIDHRGRELWKTDGTSAGTQLVFEARAGSDTSNPQTLTPLGTKLYFTALISQLDNALFETDGTTQGTRQIFAWPVTRQILFDQPALILGVHLGVLYLAADQSFGRELWRSDATANGTVLVRDLLASGGSDPSSIVSMGNRFYFTAGSGAFFTRELWTSDGTAAGTQLLLATVPFKGGPSTPTVVGSRLFFSAGDARGSELWTSDGTVAGTTLVKDIWPGANSSGPGGLTPLGAGILFSADDGVTGREIWASDGTANGTQLVVDVQPAPPGATQDARPAELTDRFGVTYFQADDGVNGLELWRTDGTAAGTWLVKDLLPGPDHGSPTRFRLIGDTLYFTAASQLPTWQLWKSDGTAQGTVQLTQLGGDTTPQPVTAYGGRGYFGAAHNGVWGLYATDGTPQGTVLVRAFPYSGAWDFQTTVAGGVLFFVGADSLGRELWKSDGTTAGTVLVKDTNSSSSGAPPQELTEVGGRLVFRGSDGAIGYALWVSDGTTSGTVRLGDATGLSNLTRLGSVVLFSATDPRNGPGLLRTDGTAAGTTFLRALDMPSYAWRATLGQQLLLFSARDAASGLELWRSDGTAAGTTMVKDIRPGPADGITGPMFATGSRFAFLSADDGVNGPELWRSDGTAAGTTLVQDLRTGPQGALTPWFQVFFGLSRGELLLAATDGSAGLELYRLDPGASVELVGTSCGASRPSLDATDPVLGATMQLAAGRAPAGKIGLVKLGFPDGAPLGFGTCFSYVDLRVFYLDLGVHFVTQSDWGFRLPVPNDAGLVGLRLAFQAWYLRASYPFDFELSNGVGVTLGR